VTTIEQVVRTRLALETPANAGVQHLKMEKAATHTRAFPVIR
jgi:hypothetical protein